MAAPVRRGGCHASGSGRIAIWFTRSVLRYCSAGCAPWPGSVSRFPVEGGVRITDQSRSSHALNPLELSTRNRTQIPRWASACDSPCVSTVVIAHATIFEMDGEFLICAN